MRKSSIFLVICLLSFIGVISCLLCKYYFRKPTISVIISSYNMGDTLPRAIDSILNQTVSDFELIVINDGSLDNTDDVLKYYLKKDPRIQIIKNEKNLGLIASLNKGLKKAKGKYIALLDADDTSYPDRFERQIAFLEKYDLDISGANYDYFGIKYRDDFTFSPEELTSDFLGFRLFFRNIFGHDAVLYRKDFLDKEHLKYNPERPNAEDYDLWLQFFMHGAKMGFMGGKPVTTYKHTGHNQNYWKISDDSVIASKKEALKKIIPDFDENLDLKPQNVSCDLLRLMIEGNSKTNVLNQKNLIIFKEKWCH